MSQQRCCRTPGGASQIDSAGLKGVGQLMASAPVASTALHIRGCSRPAGLSLTIRGFLRRGPSHHLTGSFCLDAVGHAAHLDVGAVDVSAPRCPTPALAQRGCASTYSSSLWPPRVGQWPHRAVLLLEFSISWLINEVLDTGVLQADAVDEAQGVFHRRSPLLPYWPCRVRPLPEFMILLKSASSSYSRRSPPCRGR